MSSGQLAALAGLGALHGVNPAMGWLFAVAMGLQERSRAAVLRALGPIGLGHALSVALVVALVEATSSLVPANAVRIGGALLLLAFGSWKLLARRSHPRFVGLRLTPRELVGWSFLMSSAHGAGLMLLPVLGSQWPGLDEAVRQGTAAAGVHAAAMLSVTAAMAVLVYEVVGVGVLRRGWVNLDRLWAAALLAAALGTLLA